MAVSRTLLRADGHARSQAARVPRRRPTRHSSTIRTSADVRDLLLRRARHANRRHRVLATPGTTRPTCCARTDGWRPPTRPAASCSARSPASRYDHATIAPRAGRHARAVHRRRHRSSGPAARSCTERSASSAASNGSAAQRQDRPSEIVAGVMADVQAVRGRRAAGRRHHDARHHLGRAGQRGDGVTPPLRTATCAGPPGTTDMDGVIPLALAAAVLLLARAARGAAAPATATAAAVAPSRRPSAAKSAAVPHLLRLPRVRRHGPELGVRRGHARADLRRQQPRRCSSTTARRGG